MDHRRSMAGNSSPPHNHVQQRRRRAPLLSLIAWFSVAAAMPLQHRVRTSSRHLQYRHVLENRKRGHHKKFWIPSTRSNRAGSNLNSQGILEPALEILDSEDFEETLWSLRLKGNPNENYRNNDPRLRSYSNGRAPSTRYLRQLFEQFIGQDSLNDEIVLNSTSNVTTVVTNDTINETSIHIEADDEVYNDTNSQEETQHFQPLRIRAILPESAGKGELLTEDERRALFHDMLSPALLAWGNTLRVDPVVGNLTVDVTQLVDGETCGPGIDSGLPSMRVPVSHMTEGIADTDMLVYLSLDFVVPRFYNDSNATDFGGNSTDDWLEEVYDEESTEPDDFRRSLQWLENATIGAPLIEKKTVEKFQLTHDSIVDNTTDDTATVVCNGDYLAAASFCSTDQYDRPTAALLHICIDEDFFDPSKLQRNIVTLMHELGHALGFNSLSMAHFRRTDGTPYTTRVNGEVPDSLIECTGPQADRRWATVALPSEEVLRFREVRGGVRVAELVTPSVLQVVRNHFDCQELTGAELESGEALPLDSAEDGYGCIGDHWERRLFSGDLMNPVVDDSYDSPRISTLTLAYFADSGWYQVDLSGSRVASGWGRGAGCGFAMEACISENGEVPPQNTPFFCNEIPTPESRSISSEIHGCTHDLARKAICSMGHYGLDLPWEYQYFHETYGSDVGGNDALMDYCPVYLGFDNGLCSSSEAGKYMQASQIEEFGQRNSRCVKGNINRLKPNTALCLPIACVIEDRSLRIRLGNIWHRCLDADQLISEDGVVVWCPDPRRVCPTFFCRYDCLGTSGQCDYESGNCMCEYDGISVNGEPVFQVCGLEGEDVDFGPGVFLRPTEADEIDSSVLPHPDSPLSDYYVPTERELQGSDEPILLSWAVLGSGVGAIILLFLAYVWWRKYKHDWQLPTAWFLRSNDEGDPTVDTIQRNKDKMVASVLVDMRIQANAQLNESLAETVEQLTESEASREEKSESLSEYSSRQSDTLSEVDTSFDDTVEETMEELPQNSQIIRRRRVALDEQMPA